MKNLFNAKDTEDIIKRIDKLTNNTKSNWGTMNVAQMLAHCNVTYELVYDNKHPKPNTVMKYILKLFVKNTVVSETPYKKNGTTAPMFKIKSEKDFGKEKERLIQFINKTQQHGDSFFDNKESHSFGKLTKSEWNNMFYKHLDHHLKQFGV